MTKKIEVELPVIPREVAEAIEWFRRSGPEFGDAYTDAEILEARDATNRGTPEEALQKVSPITLTLALSIGYEIERTPEEIAAERKRITEYRLQQALTECASANSTFANGNARGIRYTIGVLAAHGYENLPNLTEVSE